MHAQAGDPHAGRSRQDAQAPAAKRMRTGEAAPELPPRAGSPARQRSQSPQPAASPPAAPPAALPITLDALDELSLGHILTLTGESGRAAAALLMTSTRFASREVRAHAGAGKLIHAVRDAPIAPDEAPYDDHFHAAIEQASMLPDRQRYEVLRALCPAYERRDRAFAWAPRAPIHTALTVLERLRQAIETLNPPPHRLELLRALASAAGGRNLEDYVYRHPAGSASQRSTEVDAFRQRVSHDIDAFLDGNGPALFAAAGSGSARSGPQSPLAHCHATLHGIMAGSLHLIACDASRIRQWHALFDHPRCGVGNARSALLAGLTGAISHLPDGDGTTNLAHAAARTAAFERIVHSLASLSPQKRADIGERLIVALAGLPEAEQQAAAASVAASVAASMRIATLPAIEAPLQRMLQARMLRFEAENEDAQRDHFYQLLAQGVAAPSEPALASRVLSRLIEAIEYLPDPAERVDAFVAVVEVIDGLDDRHAVAPIKALLSAGECIVDEDIEPFFDDEGFWRDPLSDWFDQSDLIIKRVARMDIASRDKVIDRLVQEVAHTGPGVFYEDEHGNPIDFQQAQDVRAVLAMLPQHPMRKQVHLMKMFYDMLVDADPANAEAGVLHLQVLNEEIARFPPKERTVLIAAAQWAVARLGNDVAAFHAYEPMIAALHAAWQAPA